MIRGCFAAVLSLIALAACSISADFGPIESSGGANTRQIWMMPGAPGVSLRAVVYRPAGDGPFPLALISHGSSEDVVYRAQMADPDYPVIAAWLVARGFVVVVPQRPGHGQTGGAYLETAGSCEQPDFRAAGLASAAVLASVIEYMRIQAFIARDPVLLIGHSAGGWASLALAGTRPDLVRGVVLFAPGRGGRSNNQPNRNCDPDRLVAAAGGFGATARAPVIWLYAANDTYFSPALGRRIADAYGKGGAPTTFVVAPSTSEDGHFFVHDKQAVTVLSAPLTRLLRETAPRSR